MTPTDRTEQLLSEILATQRAHFEEYKRVTSESLELQRRATEAQARHLRVYRRVMAAGSVVIGVLILYALWLGSLIVR
jgi:hypothetical protein